MASNKDLSENQHFLVGLAEPYIMGSEEQLKRVLSAHTYVHDIKRYTITAHYTFIYELSSLLEHLNMLTKYRLNANLKNLETEQKINDFRIEIRHTGRFDEGQKKRDERLGKNPKLAYKMTITDTGIKIGNTNLDFKEIDTYIQQVKLEIHSLATR